MSLATVTRLTASQPATACAECGQRPATSGHCYCQVCLDEYVAGLHRRRDAEARLAPLHDCTA